MTLQANKRRGRQTETTVVNWLQTNGHPHAERRRLEGINDRGDITGIPGLVVEVKSGNTDSLGALLTELEREQTNDRNADGLIIIRRRGITDVGRWPVIMTAEQALRWWGET